MNPRLEQELQLYFPLGVLFTGSRVICDPPVLDTDEDVVVLSHYDSPEEAWDIAQDLGFNPSTTVYGDKDTFRCYRRGNVNLIIVYYEEDFERWVAATVLAKRFNLLKKEDRCALFAYVVDGKMPEQFK